MRRTTDRLLTVIAGITAITGVLSLFAPAAPIAAAGQLVISELQTGGCTVSVATAACPSADQDGSAEFIELANLQTTPITVHGWSVQYVTASGKTVTTLATLDGSIAAGGFVLLSQAGYYPAADLVFGASGDGGKLAASGGYVQLVNEGGAVQDAVGWGSVAAPQLSGWPAAAAIPYGESIGRILPGNPLYGSGQVFAAASWQVSPLGGSYQPALPIDSVTAPVSAVPATIAPVIITALRWNDGAPVFVQLYNMTGVPVSIHDWRLELQAHNATDEVSITLAAFADYIVPHGYVSLGDGTVTGADISFTLRADVLHELSLMPAQSLQLIVPPSSAASLDISTLPPVSFGQWWQRTQSNGKYTVTGAGSDFGVQTGSAALMGGGLYTPPAGVSGLEIVEILPHAPGCSPVDTRLICNDYVKLFNAGSAPLDLTAYRLRSDSGGLKSSSSNTFSLPQTVQPGDYLLVNSKDDGSPLSLTDSGGYVWLEDAYGVQLYQPIIQYPSAGPDSKIGWSWAFDGRSWQWTATPQPDGPNAISAGSAATDADPVIALLKPCAPNQIRNPATNRCKLAAAASTRLTACSPGQTRNPDTNRCRSVLGASTTLQPCAIGQSRNPATNRCRKDTAAPAEVHDVTATNNSTSLIPWALTATVAAGATAYGVYEWRQDIMLRWHRLRSWALQHAARLRRSKAT